MSDFRSKSTTYGALANGLRGSQVKFASAAQQPKIQRDEPLKEARLECD